MASDTLLDSGILIRHLRNYAGYVALTDHLSKDRSLFISSFTRFEVMRGLREHERERTMYLLNSFICLPIDINIADLAGKLVSSWKSKNVALGEGDVLIAATALHYELDLVTTNVRHFPMTELTVWQVDNGGQIERWPQE